MKSNLPEYTVSEISGAVKAILEGSFARIRVRGEISGCKYSAAGHVYYYLKDEQSNIKAVIWRSQVPRLGLKPEDGMDVVVTGKISSYNRNSSYQIITQQVEYAGIGAMLARIEQLRKKLDAEGLFQESHKKALPFLPQRIGVITSPQGAVIHDICTTLIRRFPREVMIWPVAVQGEGAAEQIAKAIEGFSSLPRDDIDAPDIVIIARGGGSVEDLMPFSDEAVVRAAFNCPIPMISAIGHDTDRPLIDDVADRRAPTPTGAAEIAVPVRAELKAQLQHDQGLLQYNLQQLLRHAKAELQQLALRLPHPHMLQNEARQKCQNAVNNLNNAIKEVINRCKLLAAPKTLPDLSSIIEKRSYRVRQAAQRLQQYMNAYLKERHFANRQAALTPDMLLSYLKDGHQKLRNASQRLQSVSPYSVLKRGYSMVTDQQNRPVTHAKSLKDQQKVHLIFSDGHTNATINAKTKKKQQQGELEL